jgi:pyruvate dehydrogenase E1 component alpha subunit
MNLASIWKLPVIFVCENNQYAITNSYENSVAVDNVSDRAVAYNMPGILVDGQNVEAMYDATAEAVKRARDGDGPTLIEGLTYRFEDHSLGLGRVTKGEYRSKEEIDKWKERDPIDIHTKKLIERGTLSESECKEIENNSIEEIEEAVNFARNSKFPEPEDLFNGMWANPIPKP